ncbi:MAG: RICIN domain-containing protein [Thiolinea sp.]
MFNPQKNTLPVVKTSMLAALLLTISSAVQAETFSGYYKFQTMFLEKENKCLEGNKLAAGSTLGGAAFMDNCQNVSGQLWKFVPAGNGYYRLQTMFLEKENKCLEGNKVGSGSTLGGAAFMDNCQNVSGQLWKPVATGNGYYRLKTMFLEPENKCLEGNKFTPSSTLKGAAFMDNCQNVSGQLWKFVKVQ